ncbi:MAG: hypothetical protein Q7S32_02130 [bacterium]|nr:hypothetical protein [bacterium]
MFKKIDIQFKEPLCGCEEDRLKWFLVSDKKSGVILGVYCSLCGLKIYIPYAAMQASISFDNQYPKKKPLALLTENAGFSEDDKTFLKRMRIDPD